MTITTEQAAKLHGSLPGVQTAMMNGDCLAVLLCSHFCDGEPNPDSENGWSERAEAGYEEVIAAIRAHYDPVIRALIASEAARKLAEERLAKAMEALQEARDKAHSHAHDEYDGVWLESDFAELTPKADAILKEIDNG